MQAIALIFVVVPRKINKQVDKKMLILNERRKQ